MPGLHQDYRILHQHEMPLPFYIVNLFMYSPTSDCCRRDIINSRNHCLDQANFKEMHGRSIYKLIQANERISSFKNNLVLFIIFLNFFIGLRHQIQQTGQINGNSTD